MRIMRVEDSLVATARIGGLEIHRLLVVQERGSSSKQVAVDPVGCKPGDWVIVVGSSAARDAAGSKEYPSDLTIVGIIDYWEDGGAAGVPAGGAKAAQPSAPATEARPVPAAKAAQPQAAKTAQPARAAKAAQPARATKAAPGRAAKNAQPARSATGGRPSAAANRKAPG